MDDNHDATSEKVVDTMKSSEDLIKAEEDRLSEADTKCGYNAACKPSCLQKFATPKVFLLLITSFAVVQGFAVNGINSVNLASYERQFQLTSRQSSMVSSVYDICAGFTVIFVGYFGGTRHQPRILGSAAIALGIGTLVMSLAHFSSPYYRPVDDGVSLTCLRDNANATTCDESSAQSYLSNYMYVLILGQLINGYAGSVVFSLGIAYIDQSVPAKVAPIYLSIMVGGSVLGPALGFVVGGTLLNFYVDYPLPPPQGLTKEHPAWVGAWWIGLLLSSGLSFIIAFFMYCFPRELPGTAELRDKRISEAHNDGTELIVNRADFGLTFKDMPKATWYLLKNPVFLFVSLGGAIEFVLVSGTSSFFPKIIANQFNITAYAASLVTGAIAVPAAVVGQLLGGYICKRLDLTVRGLVKFTLISTVIAFALCPVYLARCPETQMAGVLTAYPGSNFPEGSSPNLTSECNTGCGCSTRLYDPVCGEGIQYFTPCHAGCRLPAVQKEDGVKEYQNCSCLTETLSGDQSNHSSVVKGGICDLNCNILYYLFIPICFFQFFSTFLGSTPGTMITLRAVPEKQRAFAMSLNWVFLRFLGSIPGPIIFGTMIDASCALWQEDCSQKKGSCWIYDNEWLSYQIVILVVIFKILKMVTAALCLKLYNPQDTQESTKNKNPSSDTTIGETKKKTSISDEEVTPM